MILPKGVTINTPSSSTTKVCKFQKSIYGLKQTSRQWYSKLSESLISICYKHSLIDYSLSIKHENSSFTILLIYIDDIVLFGNDLSEINSVKAYLHNCFKIKDLCNIRFFIGLETARSFKGIMINK